MNTKELNWMIKYIIDRDENEQFTNFITSIKGQLDAKCTLSEKQIKAVNNIYDHFCLIENCECISIDDTY